MRFLFRTLAVLCLAVPAAPVVADDIAYGPRPLYLIDQMAEGPLKDKLASCKAQTPVRTQFSIGHRGAPAQFAEHTVESNLAAAQLGAGILECDVTFTQDKELICRHAQNDLHKTTNILATDLAAKCSDGSGVAAECRTTDITLAEYRTLTGTPDTARKTASSVGDFIGDTKGLADLLSPDGGQVMTHAESIALFRDLGAKFTPELKSPSVDMPFDGFTQADYAQKLIDEYKDAGIAPADVWAQSFNLDDVLYWIENEPAFGEQAVFLDGRYNDGIDANDPTTFRPSMVELKAMGVNFIAPPMWMLVTTKNAKIVPSAYATEARAAGLKLITWTIERSGPLTSGGGWYYQSISDVTRNDGVMYELIDVLARDVGVEGIFSDWPATVTYYANCFGLE